MDGVTVERDPFPAVCTCSDGINQHQDPGLEPERRRMAERAVRHAINRDIFYLDTTLQRAEDAIKYWREAHSTVQYLSQEISYYKQISYYKHEAEQILEEMMNRG